MRCEKVCFSYGLGHRAAQHHSPEEVTQAVKSLKYKHRTTLLSFEDLSAFVALCTQTSDTYKECDDEH